MTTTPITAAPHTELTAAAHIVRINAEQGPAVYPFDPTGQRAVAALLDALAAEMERLGGREILVGYQPAVVDRMRQPHDTWTAALTLARALTAGAS